MRLVGLGAHAGPPERDDTYAGVLGVAGVKAEAAEAASWAVALRFHMTQEGLKEVQKIYQVET